MSLKKYFAIKPQGNAISSLLNVVPSIATFAILSPRSLILIIGSQVVKLLLPKTLPLNYLYVLLLTKFL